MTKRLALSFLMIAGFISACGLSGANAATAQTASWELARDPLVLSDIYGVCSTRYIDGVREIETHGDMVRGRVRFDTDEGQRVLTLQIGSNYGFSKKASGDRAITYEGEVRSVGIVELDGLAGYLVTIARERSPVEVLIQFDEHDLLGERQARKIAVSVASCSVHLDEQR